MTAEEERNLAAAQRWVLLYNTDPERFCDEMLTDDSEMHARHGTPGLFGREACRQAVRSVLAAYPDRRIQAVALAASGDTVFAELRSQRTRAADGVAEKRHLVCVLRFRDGRVATDHDFEAMFD